MKNWDLPTIFWIVLPVVGAWYSATWLGKTTKRLHTCEKMDSIAVVTLKDSEYMCISRNNIFEARCSMSGGKITIRDNEQVCAKTQTEEE